MKSSTGYHCGKLISEPPYYIHSHRCLKTARFYIETLWTRYGRLTLFLCKVHGAHYQEQGKQVKELSHAKG